MLVCACITVFYRVSEPNFQFTATSSIYRTTNFHFTKSLSFNLPNHKLSIYRITNFQFTAYHVFQFTTIINFNLPYHENSIYRVMKILPNHRICEISIYHRTDKSISVHESSVLSGGVCHVTQFCVSWNLAIV